MQRELLLFCQESFKNNLCGYTTINQSIFVPRNLSRSSAKGKALARVKVNGICLALRTERGNKDDFNLDAQVNQFMFTYLAMSQTN